MIIALHRLRDAIVNYKICQVVPIVSEHFDVVSSFYSSSSK